MASINRCEFLTTLKIGGKVYVKGEVLFPPFSDVVVSEIESGSPHLKLYYDQDDQTIEDTTQLESIPEASIQKTTPRKKIGKKK